MSQGGRALTPVGEPLLLDWHSQAGGRPLPLPLGPLDGSACPPVTSFAARFEAASVWFFAFEQFSVF